jgi:hypothetical protein
MRLTTKRLREPWRKRRDGTRQQVAIGTAPAERSVDGAVGQDARLSQLERFFPKRCRSPYRGIATAFHSMASVDDGKVNITSRENDRLVFHYVLILRALGEIPELSYLLPEASGIFSVQLINNEDLTTGYPLRVKGINGRFMA